MKMANIEAVTNEDFEQNVIQSKVPILVDFFADWCAPCKTQTPILDELAGEFDGRIRFAKVDIDVDGNKELATKYGVLSVPTLILFSNGEIKDTMVGVTSKKKLEQKFEQVL
jgi:thioredoxin 1